MKSVRKIETRIRNLTVGTSRETDAWVLADALREFESAHRRIADTHPSPLWSKIMKNTWTILTTATAALFAMVFGIHYFYADDNLAKNIDSPSTSDNPLEAGITPTPIPQGNLVPLPIVLPSPKFRGTEKDIRVPYLNKDHQNDRPPFLAPHGTINVALKKPVTSSDPVPIIGEPELVTDGDKEAIDGCWVELGPGTQWIQIDLETIRNIYAIVFWHWHMQACVFYDVVVQVSDDPDFIMNVTTLFNNDRDNSNGLGVGEDMHYLETNWGKLIDARGIQARYVRLYSNGRTGSDENFYTEIEVYGK
jgi:F5/8 type C domain-containing protein